MENLNLSLRQRKLLHYLQQQKTYTTSEELANQLHVSSRTIRSDVIEINEALKDFHVRIASKRSWGYLLEAEDSADLKRLSQTSSSFLSRDERVRHITFSLCLADEPLNLYDLEDEMFISRTTLEHDLHALRKKYILPEPHIEFIRHKNYISFGPDERKRRLVLNRLFTDNWNYNARGNAYYQYQYLDEQIVNQIMRETNYYLNLHHIILEDINMVILNLMIAIMYYRIISGHELSSLPDQAQHTYYTPDAVMAVDEILDSLEHRLNCNFPKTERHDIYLHVSCGCLLDAQKLNFRTVGDYFSPDIITLADTYLKNINITYDLDFSTDEDFYITLLQYLRYLALPLHNLNRVPVGIDIVRSKFLIELEIAFHFQPLALEFYGNYLNYNELIYLAFCVSGAMAYLDRTATKLKTVVMCQLNLPASWNLKHQILNKFSDFIDLYALLPIYVKDNYDFSDIDLIITTANKFITDTPGCETMLISPFFTLSDQQNIASHIMQAQLNRLYKRDLPSLEQLFSEAVWHERITTDSYFSILELLANDFIDRGYVSCEYLTGILRRESILTFAFQPSIVLMYCLSPSTRTCMSVATLEHRIKHNNYKIRTFIMVCIRPGDTTIIFRLIHEIYYGKFNLNDTRFLKTKDELTEFFRQHSS